jgi:membrane-bound serine protease (ClpP class)
LTAGKTLDWVSGMIRLSGVRRLGVFLVACWLVLLSAPARSASSRSVYVEAHIEGVINPIKVRHLLRSIERAKRERAEFLLLVIDTPGGLVSSMQEMVGAITNSPIPVVGFVAPQSAQATSAGAFILLATDVAAMAPGTRVGAAHPVADGKPLEGAMNDKATNSLASLIKSLAHRRGRAQKAAESMVRESKSFTAEEAHREKLVDLLVLNRTDLLHRLDGRRIGPGERLSTQHLVRVPIEVSGVDRALDRFADPTLTSILLSLGTLAIIYELSTPGIGAGGAIGAVLLVLGLLGSSVLPIDLSALALFLIGMVAIALEVKLPTHGVLGGAGVVALVLGGMLLVDSSEYFGGVMRINPMVVVPTVVAAGLALLVLGRAARRALSAPPETGREALIGKRGLARSSFGSAGPETEGQVFVDGARWLAHTDEAQIVAGEPVEVTAIESQPTRLRVRRAT